MKFMPVKRALGASASRYIFFAKSVVIRAKSGVTNARKSQILRTYIRPKIERF
jgi:hypothetical protein